MEGEDGERGMLNKAGMSKKAVTRDNGLYK